MPTFQIESLANTKYSVAKGRDDEAIKRYDDRGNGKLPEGDGNGASREKSPNGPPPVSTEI